MSEASRNAREKLAQLYLLWVSNPSDQRLQEKFALCCMRVLKTGVAHNVYRKGLYPSFLAPATFIEDAISLALEKFWKGLHQVRDPNKFAIWLMAVAHSAVIEELMSWIRRTKEGQVNWEPLEKDIRDNGDQRPR
jgi:hypothetical protein